MTLSALPSVNAVLNSASVLLLLGGYWMIRRRAVPLHATLMVTAFAVSTLFLTTYLYYHAHAGSVPYPGRGWPRKLYFAVLIPHTVLAALNVPFILRTLYLAWKGDFERHRSLARWVLPAWLYVSATGVLVYLMLYHKVFGG